MNYDYNFNKEEENLLYEELKKIINSEQYKLLKIDDSFVIYCLLMKNLDKYYFNNNSNNGLDLDMLYKIWGSRVCTNDYSVRHLVSFINDILINSGFLSCKILTEKKDITSNIFSGIIPNSILLCIIINNIKIFIDLEERQILEYNNFLSKFGYNCYQKIFDKHSSYYFIKNQLFNEELININGDHLFTMNNFYYANEYTKNDYKNKSFIRDYINFYSGLDYNLFDINDNNGSKILLLNNELSQMQNYAYKKVKKI